MFCSGSSLNILTNEYAFLHLYTSLLRQLFPIKIQKRLVVEWFRGTDFLDERIDYFLFE